MTKRWGPCISVEAELEVQRTIKRAELTAFVCLLIRMIRPIKVHVDSKGIIDGLRRRQSMHQAKSGRCRFMDENYMVGMLVEVEHVKAHRMKKEKKHMSQFERFVAEGNEKADELAKARAILDEGLWSKQEQRPCSRSETLQNEACFHCLVEEWKD